MFQIAIVETGINDILSGWKIDRDNVWKLIEKNMTVRS